MKRILSVLLVIAVILSQTFILVNAEALSDGITKTQAKYEDYITEAISKSEFEENQIDKDNIFIVELTNPMAIKNDSAPLTIYVAMPIIDTDDISYAGFAKDKYITAITNFSSLASVENPYGNKLKKYIEDNNLSEPTEIKILQIIERLHLFAYYVVCDDAEYIIPYHFTNESNFNITNADECNLEYGKAYTVNEFNSICDKEQVLFEEERKKQAETENKDKTYVDNDGEVVEQKTETNKADSVNEDKETEEKAEQKDTSKEIFTFDELAKISAKDIKKISIACSRNGRTEYSTSSPIIISNIVNTVKDIEFEKEIRTSGGGAGGWLYGINFYMEDETYIQFGTRLYIDKINYISLEHETAIEIMKNYHDLIEGIDSSEWATDYILECMELGFLEDVSELNYKEPITREKFCEIVYNMLDKTMEIKWQKTSPNPFRDTFNEKVFSLCHEGVINGKGDYTFAPDDYLTREEAATILIRTAQLMEIGMPENAYDDKVYDDEDEISEWAFPSVHYCRKLNIMVGTSETEFSPKETYTAEQAVATVMRLYKAHIGADVEE